ncbi:glycoside hydrolase family protein [Candidatus Omnitrophus magneticus]|uniref:Glycoside hydrolase family protein n=1 Tax=Candidatus Omnitrophus magneticus TaxID=1609969 RepID=A0A0F0CPJ0_9BACT|nr:glycoside hydrolase family protein [Candidatus Omnitrophus magneticus]
MMTKKLSVAFLWHMHQPLYKDFVTGKYHLPWVRLHSTYSYYDMISLLEEFPAVKGTFNITPVLMFQLLDISNGGGEDDTYLELSLKHAGSLTKEDKLFMLKYFFSCHPQTAIYPFHKYKEILYKRGDEVNPSKLIPKLKDFTEQDFRDLQVFFNLAWCGFTLRTKDVLVKTLVAKAGDYTEEEKLALLAKQKEIVRAILPLYKKMQDKGQIEVSTTPYYHPILPLLARGDNAHEGYHFEIDADWHVKKAVELYKQVFDWAPRGMWPAEGSVGPEVIPIFEKYGIKWIATDEAILMKSFKDSGKGRDDLLFSLFNAYNNNSKVSMVFRDIHISNAISFRYSHMPPEQSSRYLCQDILGVKHAMDRRDGQHIISIILDGENPWPYYPDGGKEFLSRSYKFFTENKEVEVVNIGDYAVEHSKEAKRIDHLARGSWINGDFRKWIGLSEKNKAWEYLSKVREEIFKWRYLSKEALEELYIAEGSDWFWWYDEFGTELNYVFDDLFRMHLANIYKIMGKEIPEFLQHPICGACGEKKNERKLEGIMEVPPVMDGLLTDESEWLESTQYTTRQLSMEMVRTDAIIESLGYGSDMVNLYVIVKPAEHFLKEMNKHGFKLGIDIYIPSRVNLELCFDKHSGKLTVLGNNGEVLSQKDFNMYIFNKVMEIKIPFNEINVSHKSKVEFNISVIKDGQEQETWPNNGVFQFFVPGVGKPC